MCTLKQDFSRACYVLFQSKRLWLSTSLLGAVQMTLGWPFFWEAAQEAANPLDLGHKSVIRQIVLLGRCSKRAKF